MRLQTHDFQQTDRFRSDCHAPCWGWCLVICALLAGASGETRSTQWSFRYDIAWPDLGDTTNDLAVSDIDGDGLIDIVTDKYLYWFKNPGKKSVNWERIPISGDTGQNWWLGHWTGDFDGDGDQDVVSGHCADTYVYWFENLRGDGRTWRRHRLSVHGDKWKDHIRSHDFNGDGRDDLIVQKYHGSGVYYLEAPEDPNGPWAHWRIGRGRAGVCLYDIDRDDDMDVCVENTWLENPGDPRREDWTSHTIDDSVAGVKVAAGDLNGDGFGD
ncbi:MAG: VCBS repeat-containing protein, partial [Planctomycetes bacterium]|nr:VCBS repeat-containing protein [Planctomycetota bacterium]